MTEETRTTSATGGQKGVKAQRHSLLPRHGLDVIAEVFGFGAQKYEDHNWRRGYEWSKSYDALQRHLTAWWDGEDLDPESGLSHLGHAGFHILVLATWERLDGQGSTYDDRHTFTRESAAEEEARLLEEQDKLDEETLVSLYHPFVESTPEYVVGAIHEHTGTTSDVPSGIGDFEEEVDIEVMVHNEAGDDFGPDLLPKRVRVPGARTLQEVQDDPRFVVNIQNEVTETPLHQAFRDLVLESRRIAHRDVPPFLRY